MSLHFRPRIAVAGFQHETNTFVPCKTSYADFEQGGGWPPISFGAAVTDVFHDLNIPLGGFLRAAEAEAEILPVLWANAEPAGYVTREAFERISGLILEGISGAGGVDGVYLDLHGAMVTEDSQDGDGELLRRVRERVGPDVPLVASLDFHANVSANMVEQADCLTIYRTYPHLDMDKTGARAWELLRHILRSGERPAKAFRQASRLIQLPAQCTDVEPVRGLYRRLDEEPDCEILSADIALGFPLADVRDLGPSVVVYASSASAAAERADGLLDLLERTIAKAVNAMLPPEEAVAEAMRLSRDGGTVVLADVQDNSGAGAMSDTTGLLEALIRCGASEAVLGALWDPEAAQAARAAGVGSRIALELGGRNGPEGVRPLDCVAEVLALSDGRFTCTGGMQHGVLTDIGPSALLRLGAEGSDVKVLVCSRRHQCIDRELFRHLGVEPSRQRIVAVKSTVHFRADFAHFARAVINVDAPGYNPCRLEGVSYRNVRSSLTLGQ